ncbi:PREDICTED: ceramide-1-phosphate transfer protein [Drosophila arizonae]|uniref:Ceramide-1-phosphate transfer protein n=1 Tax=Drosophila arizonae TaxID=7263 RepID=A0ABM1PFJ5_DROAR|nr:PREDICTED: ceramide-1-phosphate transfer protein [Drosophila arizonae]XP_017865982.1 PREDICTED: ceramide-1-phosphate transfer protein [Drosophila arizonae]
MSAVSDSAGADNCFDIEKVSDLFEGSLIDDDDVRMDDYLEAYEEIMKFFLLMGSVFTFVSSDVRNKLDILYDLRQQDNEENKHFDSIKTMLLYEKGASLLHQKGYVSGSRTLLRLHRGLEFVYEFLLRLQDVADEEKAHHICKSAYNDTLAKHHPFLIRKGAQVAMFAIPTRGELFKRVCNDANVSNAIQRLPDMLRNMQNVYNRTDQLYTLEELHSLP